MTDIQLFLYPFWIFVDLIRDDLLSMGLFWAVIVALCGCSASYLIQIVIRRSYHD